MNTRTNTNAKALAELGYPLRVQEWYGFFCPASPRRRLSSAAELAQMLKADAEQWCGLIKQTGFTAES